MKKRGRPPVDDPRTVIQFVRLNTEESNRLDDVCKDFGMSRSDTLRKLIDDHKKKGE